MMKKTSVLLFVVAIGVGALAMYTRFETISDLQWSANMAMSRLRQAAFENPQGALSDENRSDYEYHGRVLEQLRDAKALFVQQVGASVGLLIAAVVLRRIANRKPQPSLD